MLPIESVLACQCCQKYSNVEINVTDMSDYFKDKSSYTSVDSNYLHDPFTKDRLTHDPYTPESIDSHSPNPDTENAERKLSVSPRILKSRLEHILRSENDQKSPFLTPENPKFTYQTDEILGYVQENSENNENMHKTFNKTDKNSHLSVNRTQSDSLNQILQHKSRNFSSNNLQIFSPKDKSQENTHQILFHTQSDVPNRILHQKQCHMLFKSQSQNLETTKDVPYHFRKRCMTDISRKTSKAKLIGSDRAQSITRLQSHHSSSDEEWFEFVECDIENDVISEVKKTDVENIEKEEEKMDVSMKKDKKIKKKKIDACCCIC